MPDLTELSPGYTQVLHVAAPLICLMVLSLLARGIPRVLLAMQSIYWFLAYVPRPLLLLATTPAPSFGDDLADPRLAITGYDYNIAHVLAPLAVSLWIYTGLVAAFVVWQRVGPARPPLLKEQSPTILLTFAAVWLLGALGRITAYATGQLNLAGEVLAGNPYLTFVTDVGAVGSIGLIVFVKLRSPQLTAVIIAAVAASELIWGIVEQSKTPFLGAVLALVLRLSSARMTRGRAVAVVGMGFGVLAIFGWLQSFKLSATDVQTTATADASYPEAFRPFLSIVRRFDLFAASTDSYYLDGRPYLSLGDVFQRLVLNLVPQQLGVQKIPSGTEWATRVRGQSVDMTSFQVSLAEGHFNEGYAVHGYLGVAVESVIVLGFVAVFARFLASRSVPLLTIGLGFISLPALLERGALGISEILGKGLQQAVVVSVIAAAIWFVRRNRDTPAPPTADIPLEQSQLPPKRPVLTLAEAMTIIRRGWWIVAIATAIGTVAGGIYGYAQPTTYESTAHGYVVVNNSGTSGGDAYNAGQAAQGRMASYTTLATSPAVTASVAQALDLNMAPPEVAAHLNVAFKPGSLLMGITASAATPELAASIAAETLRQLQQQVAFVETPTVGVPPWARIETVVEPTIVKVHTPAPWSFAAAGALIAAVMGLALAAAYCKLRPMPRGRSANRADQPHPPDDRGEQPSVIADDDAVHAAFAGSHSDEGRHIISD